jgi:hypothetical protein
LTRKLSVSLCVFRALLHTMRHHMTCLLLALIKVIEWEETSPDRTVVQNAHVVAIATRLLLDILDTPNYSPTALLSCVSPWNSDLISSTATLYPPILHRTFPSLYTLGNSNKRSRFSSFVWGFGIRVPTGSHGLSKFLVLSPAAENINHNYEG